MPWVGVPPRIRLCDSLDNASTPVPCKATVSPISICALLPAEFSRSVPLLVMVLPGKVLLVSRTEKALPAAGIAFASVAVCPFAVAITPLPLCHSSLTDINNDRRKTS